MLSCGGMTANAAFAVEQNANGTPASAPAIVASGHACSAGVRSTSSATAGSSNATTNHHCCKKNRPEAAPKKTQQLDTNLGTSIKSAPSSGMMSDCPLAGNKSAVVSKSRGVEVRAEQAVAQLYRPEQNSPEQVTPLSTAPRLPNRGHTYLRCCVFLI